MKARPDIPSAIAVRRSESLASLVERELERMILAGELKSGERLNENALALRLGTSRGPVREAARGLEKAGLVTVVVNRGAFVREIGIEEAGELYELRALLFGHACRRAAAATSGDHRRRLEALLDGMDAAQAQGDGAAYYPLNLELHRRIFELAGSRRLTAMYDELEKQTHLCRRRALAAAERMEESNAEHRDIVAALAAGDAARARRCGEDHVLGGKRRFLAAVAGEGDHKDD